MHSYPVGRSLGDLTERTLGTGLLVVCALTLDRAWPEARYLLAQMCHYLAGERLAAAPVLSPDALAALLSAGELP